MRESKAFVRARRKELEQPKIEAAKELRYKEKRHAAKDYLSRIKRPDLIDHAEVEAHLKQQGSEVKFPELIEKLIKDESETKERKRSKKKRDKQEKRDQSEENASEVKDEK